MRWAQLPVPIALTIAVAVAVAGCSGGSTPTGGPPTGTVTARPTPDLQAFLQLPVATPSSCPPGSNGTTAGRRSPWVGTVDVSVFVSDTARPHQVAALRARLQALPHVTTVYFESKTQAKAEFARLYTCSAQVPASQVPASYRLVLGPVSQPQRDSVVRAAAALPAVSSVSCDPSSPCVGVAGTGRG